MKLRWLAGLAVAAAAIATGGLVAAAPAHADLAGAWIHRDNGPIQLCLQPTSPQQGAAVIEVTCDTTNADQRWEELDLTSNSTFQVLNVSSQLCLDAFGSASNGTQIILWPCNSISNEQWDTGTDFANLRSRVSGTTSHCLDAPGDTWDSPSSLQLYQCNGTPAQIWTWTTDNIIF